MLLLKFSEFGHYYSLIILPTVTLGQLLVTRERLNLDLVTAKLVENKAFLEGGSRSGSNIYVVSPNNCCTQGDHGQSYWQWRFSKRSVSPVVHTKSVTSMHAENVSKELRASMKANI